MTALPDLSQPSYAQKDELILRYGSKYSASQQGT
jgi:hypothetical protein